MLSAEFIVVGAGLTGATIARKLKDSGRNVIVLERRSEVAGNCHDLRHESGILYSEHGPHYFRTNSSEIWNYAKRFSEFKKFEAIVKTVVDGKIYDYPVTTEMDVYYPRKEFSGVPRNFEESVLSKMSRYAYDRYIFGYNLKQWGVDPKTMDSSLASRVELREGKDRRLNTKKYQGVPVDGYTQWIANMLSGIEVRTGIDYLVERECYTARRATVFTGQIDAYFGYSLGRLEHRSQSRMHAYFPEVDWVLPTCQVNYPHPNIKIIREIEWKHIWPTGRTGTLITQETPIRGGDEYPVPDAGNKTLYERYRKMADGLTDTVFVGRLAENRYYDMDEVMARALLVARKLCDS